MFSSNAFKWLIAAAALLAGCAALRAPIVLEEPSGARGDEAARALSVEAVEGRPDGLVLRFACHCELPEDSWLELMRSDRGFSSDRSAEVFRRIRLQGGLKAAVEGDGLEFLDRAVEPGGRVGYQLRLRAADGDASTALIETSAPLWINWQQPPAKPEGVRAASRFPGSVEITWTPADRQGALVFRRDVLDRGAKPERVGRLGAGAGGLFVDGEVEAGGVYAYRVALALDGQDLVQYGPPSGEIYVTVAAAPNEPKRPGDNSAN